MPVEERATEEPQPGTITRLDLDAGLGYVSDAGLQHAYIVVIGKTLTNREARKLFVGKKVLFRLSGSDRVVELVVE